MTPQPPSSPQFTPTLRSPSCNHVPAPPRARLRTLPRPLPAGSEPGWPGTRRLVTVTAPLSPRTCSAVAPPGAAETGIPQQPIQLLVSTPGRAAAAGRGRMPNAGWAASGWPRGLRWQRTETFAAAARPTALHIRMILHPYDCTSCSPPFRPCSGKRPRLCIESIGIIRPCMVPRALEHHAMACRVSCFVYVLLSLVHTLKTATALPMAFASDFQCSHFRRRQSMGTRHISNFTALSRMDI